MAVLWKPPPGRLAEEVPIALDDQILAMDLVACEDSLAMRLDDEHAIRDDPLAGRPSIVLVRPREGRVVLRRELTFAVADALIYSRGADVVLEIGPLHLGRMPSDEGTLLAVDGADREVAARVEHITILGDG